MKDILTKLIKMFVDDPKAITVTQTEENEVHLFTISAAKDDMGKIIGKEGKVIRAIRNVLKIPAAKHNIRVRVQLAEST